MTVLTEREDARTIRAVRVQRLLGPVARASSLAIRRSLVAESGLDKRTGPPGIKPKAPGERLPVPAGWRSCHLSAPVERWRDLAAIKRSAQGSAAPSHGQAFARLTWRRLPRQLGGRGGYPERRAMSGRV